MIKKCNDCGSELEEGCIIDHTYGRIMAQKYSKVKQITGPEKVNFSVYEADFNDIRRVLAFRCTKCNKITLYAQDLILRSNLNKSQSTAVAFVLGATLIIVILIFVSIYLTI